MKGKLEEEGWGGGLSLTGYSHQISSQKKRSLHLCLDRGQGIWHRLPHRLNSSALCTPTAYEEFMNPS